MYARQNVEDRNGQAPRQVPVHPGCVVLRHALRNNIVSFPSQTPILLRLPAADMQWRMVLLFYVRGWTAVEIAKRFHAPRHQIWKALNDWSVRALALGVIQVIDHEAFARCCGIDEALPVTNNPADGRVFSTFTPIGNVHNEGESVAFRR